MLGLIMLNAICFDKSCRREATEAEHRLETEWPSWVGFVDLTMETIIKKNTFWFVDVEFTN